MALIIFVVIIRSMFSCKVSFARVVAVEALEECNFFLKKVLALLKNPCTIFKTMFLM